MNSNQPILIEVYRTCMVVWVGNHILIRRSKTERIAQKSTLSYKQALSALALETSTKADSISKQLDYRLGKSQSTQTRVAKAAQKTEHKSQCTQSQSRTTNQRNQSRNKAKLQRTSRKRSDIYIYIYMAPPPVNGSKMAV
eukprot:6474579-Amphidinium_carterae.1